MSAGFGDLDPAIQDHLESLRASAGLAVGDESLELLAAHWREKEAAFAQQAAALGMEMVRECTDPSRGFLALTYSGSLVAVGPAGDSGRRAVYISIDLRRDVPTRSEAEAAELESPALCGDELCFRNGPVKRSSAVYRLAVLAPALAAPEQNRRLDEATIALTREFQAVDASESR